MRLSRAKECSPKTSTRRKINQKLNTYRTRVVCGINKANHLLLIRRSNLILQIAATGGREGLTRPTLLVRNKKRYECTQVFDNHRGCSGVAALHWGLRGATGASGAAESSQHSCCRNSPPLLPQVMCSLQRRYSTRVTTATTVIRVIGAIIPAGGREIPHCGANFPV